MSSVALEEKFSLLTTAETERQRQASAFQLPETTSWDQILLHIERQHAANTPLTFTIDPNEWRRDIVSRYGDVFSHHTIPFIALG